MDENEMNEYGICEECNQQNTFHGWCRACNTKRLEQNFKNWTSGNDNIDKFIQNTQLSVDVFYKVLEWIPYDRFYDIKYIAKGGFGKVYKAIWIDGYIRSWDNKNQNWERKGQNRFVALKSLYNSKNITLDFINEIASHYKVDTSVNIVRLYGITQDPETKDYVMVLNHAKNGSLRNYLDVNRDKLNWEKKIRILHDIANGLNIIHEKGLVHRDLHIGNVLVHAYPLISDMGLCKPADDHDTNSLEDTKSHVYGVLPYVAPEILRGKNYTKASDVYSFGIIMYVVISGLPPYNNVSHDKSLAIKICKGFRPMFNINVPQLVVNLIKRCLDANPLNRPTLKEIYEILHQWSHKSDESNEQAELKKQIIEVDEINSYLPISGTPSTSLSLSYETHPATEDSIYTSRLLNFNNLPEPKNSDDYYEQNDNIISTKYSESLLIDISQLKMCEDDQNDKSKDSVVTN